MNEIISELERQVKRNLLRYHAGHLITCPQCQSILDCRRAVEVDIHQADKLVKSSMRCVNCFDATGHQQIADLTERGYRCEVTDGRTLFSASTAPRAPRKTTKQVELTPGTVYAAKHSSGMIRFRFVCRVDRKFFSGCRSVWRYQGVNLATGKTVELKSRGAIRGEVTEKWPAYWTGKAEVTTK